MGVGNLQVHARPAVQGAVQFVDRDDPGQKEELERDEKVEQHPRGGKTDPETHATPPVNRRTTRRRTRSIHTPPPISRAPPMMKNSDLGMAFHRYS